MKKGTITLFVHRRLLLRGNLNLAISSHLFANARFWGKNQNLSFSYLTGTRPYPDFSPKKPNVWESELVQYISTTIKQSRNEPLRTVLRPYESKFGSNHLIWVLMNIKNDYELVLDLFDWVCKLREPSLEARCIVIHIAVVSKDLKMAKKLISDFWEKPNLDVSHSFACFVEELIYTYKDWGLDPCVFDIFFEALVENQMLSEARRFFEKMLNYGLVISTDSCNFFMLRIFSQSEVLKDVLEMFNDFLEVGVHFNTESYNVIIHALCRSGKVREAHNLLVQMELRGCLPDVVSYSTVINGYCYVGELQRVLRLIDEMQEKGLKPNEFTYNSIILLMCNVGKVVEAKSVMEEMISQGVMPDHVVYTTIIMGFCKHGNLCAAVYLFKEMQRKKAFPDLITYTAIIHGLSQSGKIKDAHMLFHDMLNRGLPPDAVMYTALIDGYCKAGEIKRAFYLHNKMIQEGITPNVVTYTVLVHGLCEQGDVDTANELLHEVCARGLELNVYTYNALINGLCKVGNVAQAEMLIEDMEVAGVLPDTVTYTTLMDAYCKSGEINKAHQVLEVMLDKGVQPTIVTFNVLMNGFCMSGMLENGERLLKWMLEKGIMPNAATYNPIIKQYCIKKDMRISYEVYKGMCAQGVMADSNTYNILIQGHSKARNMKEAWFLHKEMVAKGFNLSCSSYNALIKILVKKKKYTELMGPELESSNYVVKNFATYASDFMRVTFVDEDWGRLMPHFVSTSIQQGFFAKPFRTGVYHRILSILQEGIVIGNKKFEFLAFSASQLRSNSVWMFASNDDVKAADIREWMGSFSKIRSVSKCAARMGQLFSSSKQTMVVPVQDVEVIPDVEVTTDGMSYCFSDGIGKISLSFARQVAQKCGLSHTPSAFQIRYGGYKGVIAVDRNSFRKLSLRSSMLKFESRNRMLNVTKWSESMPCYLNREIVVLLSTLGVEDKSFEGLLEQQMQLLGSMMTSREAALAVLEAMSVTEGKSILPKMLRSGYEPKAEPYLSMMLHAYLENQLFDTRYRCRLYVPKGRILLGCLDETGVLEYGQFFVRLTLTKSELEDVDQSYFQKIDEKTAILKGKMVVTKNPCLHPGDVRVLEAVYEVALVEKGVTDCLVFPQKGQRPHPNECSGGDLDGDLYFVSWDENLRPSQTVPPMDYTARRPRIMDHDVTLEEIQQFFVHYMISDSLGAISTAHLVHADRDPEKAMSPKCLQLADLHSMAVDFAKTGAPAEMPRSLKPREYPDFMERYDKPMYTSEGVLGKLYRTTVALTAQSTTNFAWSKEKAESIYDHDLEFPGFEDFLKTAGECKEMYMEKMNALMSFYGATRENEILTGNLKRHSGFLQRDNRRYLEMKDRILESIRSLQREAKGWFEASCSVEERKQMASAWYHVTYHPSQVHDSDNCISFPWVVGDTLINIKNCTQHKN